MFRHLPTAQLRNSYSFQRFSGDAFGGVTAAVVALPVALAFGVASGLGPIAGLYGAIAVGFFAAVFGGTPSQISGPTGPMTIAMAVVVTQHADNFTEAFTIVMLAGLLQIALGALRIGRFVSYTPYSVISGFMSGIGVIIIVIQTLPFLGVANVSGGPLNSIRAWPNAIANLNTDALIIGIIALAVGIFWPLRLRKFLPAPPGRPGHWHPHSPLLVKGCSRDRGGAHRLAQPAFSGTLPRLSRRRNRTGFHSRPSGVH